MDRHGGPGQPSAPHPMMGAGEPGCSRAEPHGPPAKAFSAGVSIALHYPLYE